MNFLVPIQQKDFFDISRWPQYEGVHAQMDYALRKNGWLDTYCSDSSNYCYAAKIGELCIEFSFLIKKGPVEAEFRIAVHPNYIGAGYGKRITNETLAMGFSEHKLKAITLIVRKNNPIAQRLYANQGFSLCGETTESIQGKCIDFFIMKMNSEDFMEGEIQ